MTTSIKKDFIAIIELLEANTNKKVSTILEEARALASKKANDVTFKKDADGNVTHVFCYYHKEWEEVANVEYGPKKGTATGLNTMCRVGVSQWSKQQREAKKSREALLKHLSSGEITIEQLPDLEADIEAKRTEIVPL